MEQQLMLATTYAKIAALHRSAVHYRWNNGLALEGVSLGQQTIEGVIILTVHLDEEGKLDRSVSFVNPQTEKK